MLNFNCDGTSQNFMTYQTTRWESSKFFPHRAPVVSAGSITQVSLRISNNFDSPFLNHQNAYLDACLYTVSVWLQYHLIFLLEAINNVSRFPSCCVHAYHSRMTPEPWAVSPQMSFKLSQDRFLHFDDESDDSFYFSALMSPPDMAWRLCPHNDNNMFGVIDPPQPMGSGKGPHL